MCKIGDIILVHSYKDGSSELSQHSFIVISDVAGEIQGLPYDIICNVMSSFKDENQKQRKMSYPGNFEISNSETNVKNGNNKDGFVKAEQLYYFKKDKLDYDLIGTVSIEFYNKLIDFIDGLDGYKHIIDNL